MTSTEMQKKGDGGDDFPDRQASSMSSKGKLNIQMLKREGDDMSAKGNKCVNLFLCFIALCLLYGWYIFFGWIWLLAMTELGEDLNWAFFGAMVSVGGGMIGGVAYSMKSQHIGWWEVMSRGDARMARDPRGKCCGFQVY